MQDVVKFAHQASEALDVYDAYMGVFVNFPDIPWRRSALAFLLGTLKTLSMAKMKCLRVRAYINLLWWLALASDYSDLNKDMSYGLSFKFSA